MSSAAAGGTGKGPSARLVRGQDGDPRLRPLAQVEGIQQVGHDIKKSCCTEERPTADAREVPIEIESCCQSGQTGSH